MPNPFLLAALLLALSIGHVVGIVGGAEAGASQVETETVTKPKADWDATPPLRLTPEQLAMVTTIEPGTCLGSPDATVVVDDDGIGVGGCGQTFTLTDLAAHPAITPDLLELVDVEAKIWILRAKLSIAEGVTFLFTGGADGDVNWLRLRSDDVSGVFIRGVNATLRFTDTRVTSWDETKADVDRDWTTAGRSYVSVRSHHLAGRGTTPATDCNTNGGSQEINEARMDITRSEFGYLGYHAGESYGVSWKVFGEDDALAGRDLYQEVDVFGDVTNSTFANNFFGAYTYGGYCMNFTGNVFESNQLYGLDPHDDSDHLTITDNVFAHNGTHGMICSVYCDHLTITNNESFGNGIHGIMLHRQVINSLVETNNVHDNGGAGIILYDSHHNVIRNNVVRNNAESGLSITVGSSNNTFENNTVEGARDIAAPKGYAITSDIGSDPPTEGDGQPAMNTFSANEITAYKGPVVRLKSSRENTFSDNQFNLVTAGETLTVFDFSAGAGNIVTNQRFTPDSNVGTLVRTSNPTTSGDTSESWSVVRSQPVGQTVRVAHHSIGDTRTLLEDDGGHVFHANATTVATPDGTTMSLSFLTVGSDEAVTVLDFVVTPKTGDVVVRPLIWNDTGYSWTEESADGATGVVHDLGGLKAGVCYQLTKGSEPFDALVASAAGKIRFLHDISAADELSLGVTSTEDRNCTRVEGMSIAAGLISDEAAAPAVDAAGQGPGHSKLTAPLGVISFVSCLGAMALAIRDWRERRQT